MRPTIAFVFAVSVLSATTVAAQVGPTASGEFRTFGSYYENYSQAPDTGTRRDIWVASTEIRFEDPLTDDNRTRAYLRIEFLQLRDIGSSPGVLYGVKRRGKMHRFDIYGSMQWNRPRGDVGDELDKSNLLTGAASYTLRILGLEISGGGEYREEFLKPDRITASRFHEVDASVGYRAFDGRLVPEIGVASGRRITGNAKDAYFQQTSYVALQARTIPHVSMDARYRLRRRDYTIQDVTSKNFGREDGREQVRASIDVSLGGPLIWNFFGATEKGTSTRRGRDFVARSFGTGFTLRY